MSGCSSTHYRKKADKEVYTILREYEEEILGNANDFTIDTKYSQRNPKEIPADEIVGDRKAEGTMTLSLDQALQIAIDNSREYQTEKENLYLSALSLTTERFNFAPQFLGRIDPNVQRDANGEVSIGNNSRVAATQALQTGGMLGATLVNDMFRFLIGSQRRDIVNTLSVTLSQPLLKGAGRGIARENLTQAERNVVYEIRDFSNYQREFAVDIVGAYFGLLERKAQVRNNYANYQSRVVARKRAEARAQVDGTRSADLALQSELRQKNSYINSVVQYQNALDSFRQTLNLPLSVNILLDDAAYDELSETGLLPIDIDSERGYDLAIEQYLPLLNDIDRFEDAKRKIRVVANDLKPGLDVVGDAGLRWDRDENYRDIDFENVTANLGLEIDLPFNRLRERNTYRRALITFEREIRNLSRSLDQRKQAVDQGLRALDQRKQNYEIEQLGVSIAKRRVEELELRMQAGTIDQQSLIDAQDDLIRSQNALTSALVSYLNSRLNLLLDLGVLEIEDEKFWLKPQMAGNLQPTKSIDVELSTPDELFNQQGAQ